MTASEVIARYGLRPHPEGGHFREVHRSIVPVGVPPAYPGERVAYTAILFLLAAGEVSVFHRVRSEEVWIHLAGAPLELVLLEETPSLRRLATALEGEPMAAVPPGVLQAARSEGEWTLVACFVAPGFEFEDFGIPDRRELLKTHPGCGDLVEAFTRARGSHESR